MLVLVLNAGSSSLKFGVFSAGDDTREVFKGSYERFRNGSCEYRFRHGETDERGAAAFASPSDALKGVPDALKRFDLNSIDAIGHRIVHGGARFSAPTLLDDDTVEAIAALTPLSPLHNPANLEAVRLCRGLWPNLPQVAVFDTAFHLTNPPSANDLRRAGGLAGGGVAPIRLPWNVPQIRGNAGGTGDRPADFRSPACQRPSRQRSQRLRRQPRAEHGQFDGDDTARRAGDGDALRRR